MGRCPTGTQVSRVRPCVRGLWPPGPRLVPALRAGCVRRRGQGVCSEAGAGAVVVEVEDGAGGWAGGK
jgi:hypothetical protein